MAVRWCLGTASRFSVLHIPRFAMPPLPPSVLSIAVRSYNLKAKARLRAAHQDDNFTMIYKFPYIVHATTLCRVKLYQTALTAIMIPASMLMKTMGMVSIEQCQYTGAVCILACAVLYVMSSFFRRLVGIMYLNDTKDALKVSHLSFMGERLDTYVQVQDVVPLAETGMGPKTVYYHLKLYSSKEEFYYYILRYGGIVNPEMFKLVFGEEALNRTPQKFSES